jgi:hypothetical protein
MKLDQISYRRIENCPFFWSSVQIQSFDDNDAAMRASLGKIAEVLYRKDIFFPSRLLSSSGLYYSVRTMINKTRRVRNCFETFVSLLRRLRVEGYLSSYTHAKSIPRVKKKRKKSRRRR